MWVATRAVMAGAAAGDRDGGDPKHGELARDETEAKTGGALLLRRLLEVVSAERDSAAMSVAHVTATSSSVELGSAMAEPTAPSS